jgi:hypothetical protein
MQSALSGRALSAAPSRSTQPVRWNPKRSPGSLCQNKTLMSFKRVVVVVSFVKSTELVIADVVREPHSRTLLVASSSAVP